MTSQCHSEPARNEQFHSGLLRPNDCCASSQRDCDFSHDLGGMGELKRDLGVCELPSHCAQRWSWNNKHTDAIWPKFLAFATRRSGLNAEVGFPSAAPTWNFPYGWIPRSHWFHCLHVNSESTPLENRVRQCVRWWCDTLRLSWLRWQGGPLPSDCTLCRQLPGNGNSQWLSETA